ncbi:ankyrin-3 [Nephila pilipes]|uniref:Alpha-latrotoxin n=1 Tax=Nephila pilipes TaxID=299642 RepID=A0A8X6NE94_NEPPI|nr:ankyrin-3 [Nephila pilipes]
MASNVSTNNDNLILNWKSRKRLLTEFKKYNEVSAKIFYLKILNSVKEVIANDNIDTLKDLTWLLQNIESIKSKNDLQNYLEKDQIGNFNLVALACQKKAIKVLEYLFSDKGKFLYKLTVNICESDRLFSDNDEFSHNAFYYAIRSNLVGLFNILVDKWCEVENSEQLEDVLSKEYKELKLRRVFLTNEMEFYVHNKILDIRFFQDNADSSKGSGNTWSHIKERIEMIHRDIDFLKAHYWDTDPDDKFLVKAEFIAKNIHVLNSLLNSTYDRLPWEEIEFILVIFILCCKNRSQTNLVYNSVLNKKKVLSYLESFSFALGCEQRNLKTSDVLQLAKPSGRAKLIREKVIKEITKNYPSFQELYIDYETVRDFYSLETVKNYLDLAVTVDVTEKEGQLVVMRALQVMGEHLKNTLESPKLSDSTAETLLSSLPLSTREVIINLRDSLSHEFEDDTHFIRTVVEKKPHVFFKNVQTDISKINVIITDFLYKIKTFEVKKIMKEVGLCKYLKDVEDLFGPFRLSIHSFTEEIKKTDSYILVKGDIGQVEELLFCLSSMMNNKTAYEKGLFEQINRLIQREKEKLFSLRNDFLSNTIRLGEIFHVSQTGNYGKMNYIHWLAKRFKTSISDDYIPSNEPNTAEESLRKITENLIKQIIVSAESRNDFNPDIYYIILRITHFFKFEVDHIKWIKEFKGTSGRKKKRKIIVTNMLSPKLSLLKKVLNDNNLVDNSLLQNISFFESNVELQIILEMLVLDVLSILLDLCNRNQFFLDNEFPLQIGKNMRNHLAHNNALINVLLDKNRMQLLLNAIKITKEGFSKDIGKIDKIILCDLFKLENAHNEHLSIVDNQQKLFIALEEGDIEKVQDCIKKGADIYGKDINEMTCLHYSAKAPSTETIEFVLQQNVDVAAKDLRGQTALHIAVKYDRIEIVKYLINRKLLCINETDIQDKTPLHIAVENGSKKSLKYLLKNKAITTFKDYSELSPLHTAILRNDMEMAEILLKKEKNINKNVSPGGYTVLHRASEGGKINLVDMLIQMQVDVECKTDFDITPLHIAAEYGHLEVVKTLVLKGADVNARTLSNETPLHRAAQSGEKEIVELLINCEAEVNAYTFNLSLPLSHAAEEGHLSVAELLLEKNSTVNINSEFGLTPLHFASQNGHVEFVKLLLNRGAFINQKNKKNDDGTALHYSSGNGHNEVVMLLIDRGADIEAKDKHDFTPLHLAVGRGHYEVARSLITKGANILSKVALGATALHIAAYCRFHKMVELLISNGADIRAEDKNKTTPIHILFWNDLSEILIKSKIKLDFVDTYGFNTLHLSALNGNLEFVKYCLENGCNINDRNESGLTALHLAVQGNHQDVVIYLIDKGAETNVKDNDGHTVSFFAAKNNCVNIISVLIEKTKSIPIDQIESLCTAVFEGHHDILSILLKECIFDFSLLQEKYLLHKAAENGHMIVVKILLENGFDVNAEREDIVMTPLHAAVLHDHWEIAQLLLLKEANPNAQNQQGLTPLHIAVMRGNTDVVEILLEKEADIFISDYQNKSVIELAVHCNQLDTVKILLMNEEIDVNVKGYLDRTLLHQCAFTGSLEMTEYLVESGANIHARCRDGHKPIHVAAVMGFVKIVEFYLDHYMSVNDLNGNNLTLLHIAAHCGNAKVAELLIKRSANINVSDINGEAPIHLASANGHKDIVDILLHNGAYYNVKNKLKQTPLQISKYKSIASVLKNIDRLFIAVKNNACLDVETELNEVAKNSAFSFINANCVENETLLHYASRNGYEKIIESLLKHKANPNVVNNNNRTPLHHAAEFSHFGSVKILLSNGAIYNGRDCARKSPEKCASDQNILNLFDFLNKAYIKIHNNNISFLRDMEKMKDLSKVKAVMRAKNREGKTLIEFAILCSFSKTEQLKGLFQGGIARSLELADVFIRQEKLMEAHCAYNRIIRERIVIFGADNPSVLDVQTKLVRLLNIRKNYDESLQLLEEIYRKRQDSLGAYHKETLAVQSLKALTLFEQGRNEEALHIFKEVIPKQKRILEPDDYDILESENGMASVLLRMEKYAEASKISCEVLEKSIKKFGLFHLIVLVAHHNFAATLNEKKKHAEALQIFEKAYEICKTLFSLHHSNTLRTLFNIACTLSLQKKYDDTLKILRQILDIQMVCLPSNHYDILKTEFYIGNTHDNRGMTITALRIFLALESRINIFCPNTDLAKINQRKIDEIFLQLKMFSQENVFKRIRSEIHHDGNNSEMCLINDLTFVDDNIHDQDVNGITALHLAVVNGDKNSINVLLENGFDVLKVTIEGNTALHTAAIHGYADIAEIIIKHTQQHKRSRLDDLINATTAGVRSTALHLAANVDTAMCLLKHGAMFDAKNKLDQTPLDLAGDERVFTLLKTIGDIFDSAVNGKWCVIDRIRELDSEDALAALHAHNSLGKNLLQVAWINDQKGLAKELGELLKSLTNIL